MCLGGENDDYVRAKGAIAPHKVMLGRIGGDRHVVPSSCPLTVGALMAPPHTFYILS